MAGKCDLNNELMKMKKTIQQAKICIIGKLIRKLKTINKEGKKLTGLKLVGRKTKLTDQINYLKKIHNMDLARLALTFKKNPTKILTNSLSSNEDVALAHVVTFKAVKTKVNEIKTKFGLDDNKEDWRGRVNEIGKKKKKKVDKINLNRKKELKEKNKKSKDSAKKAVDLLENVEPMEIQNYDHMVSQGESKPMEKTTKNRIERLSSPDSSSIKFQPTENRFKLDHTISTFFLTESGKSFLTTAVTDRIQPDGPKDGLDRKERRARQFGRLETVSKISNPPVSLKSNSVTKTKIQVDNLHTSWAAKMKTKVIDKCQGNKFFDAETTSTVHKTSINNSETSSGKLHPSWAAKQKLKPVISEFKGNKIIFN